jgi:acyl carrier protein
MNMNSETLKTQVRQYIVDNLLMGANAAELRDEDSFMESQVIDSVGVLELVSFLEKNFSIEVEAQEMLPENLDSLNGIARYLQRKLGGRAGLAVRLAYKVASLGVVWTMLAGDPLVRCMALALA